jgi:hypothetical protein
MWIFTLPLVYDVVALVVAVSPPAGARRAAARGNLRARRAYRRYLVLVAGTLLLAPAATYAVALGYVAVTHAHEIGVAVGLAMLLAGPGMLALLLRLLVAAAAAPAPGSAHLRAQAE